MTLSFHKRLHVVWAGFAPTTLRDLARPQLMGHPLACALGEPFLLAPLPDGSK